VARLREPTVFRALVVRYCGGHQPGLHGSDLIDVIPNIGGPMGENNGLSLDAQGRGNPDAGHVGSAVRRDVPSRSHTGV
jgi:hypothetical protein